MEAKRRRTILIVDDHEESLDVYRIYLERQGYRVVLARTGSEGLEKIRSEAPHLVLLDRKLPDMDGLKLVSDRTEGLRIICVTGRAYREDKQEALAAGVDAYLVKPAPPRQVLEAVEKLIGPARSA